MIVVKLKGGLGNQMFQYALGRRLSLERNDSLKLDSSWLQRQEKRKLELDQFNIAADLTLPKYYYNFPPFSQNPTIKFLYDKYEEILPLYLRISLKEARVGEFDHRVIKAKRLKYLEGYWQSEKYFETIKDQIRADFTLKHPLSSQDQALSEEMSANPNAVSVHIRREDYVSDFRIIKTQLVCTPDYYTETMNFMKDKLGKGVVYYVFSDDPEWCRTEMEYPSDFRIVSDLKRSASHELIMMSCCRNAIMANSSFSWWGAWLGKGPKETIIYPKKWFTSLITPDIPLKSWLAWQHKTENDWKYIDIPYVKSRFRAKYKRELNLDDPQRFTEKIQWLKIYDRKPIYTVLADKYAVRDYVAEKIGSRYLTELYGVYDKSSEIDWKKLPNRFVLKTNHGSKWIIRCKNKFLLNKKKACRQLDYWMTRNFYYHGREWQYNNIPPKIICEEYLAGDKKLGLLDYKIWCFHGKPKCVEVFSGRFTSLKRSLFDLEWNKLEVRIGYPLIDIEIPQPTHLAEMIEISKKLSEGFPYARVDLYNFDTKVVFGEMTFTPGGGYQNIQPPDFDFLWGKEIILPR